MERLFANIIYKYPSEWEHPFLSESELIQYGQLLANGIKQYVPADFIEIYFTDNNIPKLFYSSLAASDKRENHISKLIASYVSISNDAFRFPYYDKDKYPDIRYTDVLELGKSFIALPLFYNHQCIGSVNIASHVQQVFRDDIVPQLVAHIARWDVVYKSLFAERELVQKALLSLDLVNGILHPVFAVQKDCRLIFSNDAFRNFIQVNYKRHFEQQQSQLSNLVGHDFPELEILMQEAWRKGYGSIDKNYLISGVEQWYTIEAYKLDEQVLFIFRRKEKTSGIDIIDEQPLLQLYEQLPFAVLVTDRNSEIIYHNAYIKQSMGQDISGSSLLEYIEASQIKKYFRFITDVLHGEQPETPVSLHLKTNANHQITFEGYFKKINYRNNSALVFFGTDMLKEGVLLNDYLSLSHKEIFDALPLGLAITDETLSTTFINKEFAALTKYELQDLQPLPIFDLLCTLDLANELTNSITSLSANHSIARNITIDTKHNEQKTILLTASAFQSAQQQGYLLSLYDITAFEAEKQQVLEKAQQAIDAQHAEEQFLARMSHEIRTAMNGIIGLTNVMMQSGISGEQRQFLNLVKQSTDNLLVIINDILDLSKIKSGKMQFEEVPVNLKTIFENLYSIVLSKLGAKEVHLKMQYDEEIPTQLNTDPTRINQILLNLLGNAIKFTERGQIIYSAKLLGKDNHTARILIEVSDTGIGIDEKNINQIFDSYSQAESDTTRKYGGTGLGLPIVKQLVELMGGHISVKSQLHKGTTFSIELSLKICNEQIVEAETESIELDIPQGIRVLVVDDNYINRLLVTHLLKAKGFEVLEAAGGYEALDVLQEEDVDVVLMDISMPDIDGFETTRIIRKSDKAFIRQVPVVAMTAHGFQDQIRNAREAGMNNYIVKPFKPDQLYTVILQELNQTSNNEGTKENNDYTEVDTVTEIKTSKNFDLAFLEDYYDHEPSFINNILKLYVQDTPAMLDEMAGAIAGKDWKQFKALAHKIKTNIMMMGIKPVDNFFKEASAIDSDNSEHPEMHVTFNRFRNTVLQALEQIKADRNLSA
jgi:hypothetical protein